MKTFTQLNEQCVTSDVNPGNAYSMTGGVSNHYTPIENILLNVKNLFATRLGIVASLAEDGISIKLNSTHFVSKSAIANVLDNPIWNNKLSLRDYIMQQGLDFIKMICIGQYWVVYFSPSDIAIACPGLEADTCDRPCKEQLSESLNYEIEMDSYINEGGEDDEEMEDVTKKKILEILEMKDKVKAAKQLELVVAESIELPREYYFAGVKSKSGEESIALRWKYTKKSSPKSTTEITRSLINFYDLSDKGIFVADFVKDSMFQLPDEVKKLIENILDLVGAKKTSDPAIYSLKDAEEDAKDDDKKDDDKKDDDKKDDSDSSSDDKKDDKKDSDDDDNAKGGDTDADDLLG